MFKNFLLLLGIIFTVVIFTGCSNDTNQEGNDKLIVGTSADYPPLEYHEDDEIVGFEIDIIKEIAKRMDRDLEIKDMSFSTIIETVKQGNIDAAISSIEPTPERQEVVDFTDMYHSYNQGFVINKNSSVEINSKEDIKNYKIGAQTGSTLEDFLSNDLEGMPSENVFIYEDSDLAMKDVEQGKIDAVFTEIPVAIVTLEDFSDLELGPYELKVNPDTGNNIAVKKDNDELLSELNEVIKEMLDDGTIEEMKEEWLSAD